MPAPTLFFHIYFFIHTCFGIHLYQVTPPVDHGEGPAWDCRKNLLYFVDIHAGNVHSYEPSSGNMHSIHLNGEVTPVIPSKHDPELLIVGLNRTVVAVDWDGVSPQYRSEPLVTVSRLFPQSRFNDGKADKRGRLWFGTMGYETATSLAPNQGFLYKITRANLSHPCVMIAPVNISNGLAWNKANDKFYYIDTPTRKVVEYDYDVDRGDINNRRVVFDLAVYPSIRGFPDGMTIDRDDHLWIALYSGGAVIKVDPKTGHLLQIIAIPADAVTSVTWGGPNLDVLYVTTSRYRLSEEERLKQPYAGSVFAFTELGTGGVRGFEADVVDGI